MTNKILLVLGALSGALVLVKFMMNRARTDQIIGTLKGVNDPVKRDEFQSEVAKAQQEVENAKAKYSSKRRDLDKQLDPSRGGDLP